MSEGRTLKNGNTRSDGKPFTRETAREAQKKSAQKKRERRKIRECLEELLADGGSERIAVAMLEESANGNAKMMELLLKMAGEHPDKTVNVQVQTKDDPLSAAFKIFAEEGGLDGD